MESELAGLSSHDSLTGLASRSLFIEFASKVLANSARHGSMFSILVLDVDDLQTVNDKHGRATGDHLLKLVSDRIGRTVRTGDITARFGGDTFAVLLDSIRSQDGARHSVDRLLSFLNAPYLVDSCELHVTCSIGASTFPLDEQNLEALLGQAQQALSVAKSNGKGKGCMFAELGARDQSAGSSSDTQDNNE
jgi:diguanylate cyclase (GGDEF)-like protein